jgi:hypothetical protein
MQPGEPTPRSVAGRWARGARALHKNDREYALLLTEYLASRSPPAMSPLPADPLEEALILLFSGVLKELIENDLQVAGKENPEM